MLSPATVFIKKKKKNVLKYKQLPVFIFQTRLKFLLVKEEKRARFCELNRKVRKHELLTVI